MWKLSWTTPPLWSFLQSPSPLARARGLCRSALEGSLMRVHQRLHSSARQSGSKEMKTDECQLSIRVASGGGGRTRRFWWTLLAPLPHLASNRPSVGIDLSYVFFCHLTGFLRRALMSFSVSPAANFPELEPDDFCPKLSTPCIVLFPDDDDDIFDEICNKKKIWGKVLKKYPKVLWFIFSCRWVSSEIVVFIHRLLLAKYFCTC